MSEVAEQNPQPLRVHFKYSPAGNNVITKSVLTDGVLRRVEERERRIRMLSAALTLPLVFGAVFYFADSKLNGSGSVMAWLVTGVSAILLFMWARTSGRWGRYLRHARATANTTSADGEGVAIEVEVSSRGVRIAHSDQAQEYGWRYFDRVCVLDEHIGLCFANALNGMPIPRSAFASTQDADAFVAGARALLAQSGYSMLDRAKKMLGDEHCPCGRCDYDLHGLTTTTCPECGYELTTFTMWCMKYMAEPFWKQWLGRSTVAKYWARDANGQN